MTTRTPGGDADPDASLEITPESAYLTRREFLRRSGIATLGGLAIAACSGPFVPGTADGPAPTAPPPAGATPDASGASLPTAQIGAYGHDELGNPTTAAAFVHSYGYYYEFSRERIKMGANVGDYEPPALAVEVGGLVRTPLVLGAADLSGLGEVERIYRHRCLECWAMVLPWTGVPLRRVLEAALPAAEARFVRFEAMLDPAHMPGQRPGAYAAESGATAAQGMGGAARNPYRWPYVEGLRLDEAMHDLTLLATGMFGKPLHPHNGGPLRLVVPWKYGFKAIKNVRRIDLVADMPETFWMHANAAEHGFYANVNPYVPHPRWAQATEARYRGICPEQIVPSLMFNGYEDQVAQLYRGMDLTREY